MNPKTSQPADDLPPKLSLFADNRIIGLVAGAIVVTLALTAVGMGLYSATGTAQVDLSRPGLEEAGKTANQDKTKYTEYSSSGPINNQSLAEFDKLFKENLHNLESLEAFSGDPLSPEALGIAAPSSAQD